MRWLRLVRIHQWAKNGLLLLPALAAHLSPTGAVLGRLGAAVASFSLLASALYVLNDLVDRDHDRRHPTKRHRPLAAGTVGTGAAVAVMAAFALISLGLAVTLPVEFLGAWAAYLVLTGAYSFVLKRVVVLDVVVLAALYTVRVVAGAAAVMVPLSRWFLAFSVFLFLSLALVKRWVEVAGVARAPSEGAEPAASPTVAGRGWSVVDLPLLRALGVSSAVAAALVYCLYITDEPAQELYRRPDLLWAGLPLLLYWLARVWLLAERGDVDDDPVVFALKDRASWVVLVVGVLMVVTAA